MKKTMILIAIIFTAAVFTNTSARHNSYITFDYFYTSLEPYGEWIELEHDLIVWRPLHVRHNWRPYNIGRWVWSSQGWYWDSYEPFGWATFHYGRWFYDDFYGWIWIPDYEWAPAWVEWRYNDYYIGWAPLPPYATFRIDLGIHFSIAWHSSHHYWNFVRYPHFCNNNVNYYFIDNSTTYNIFSKTKYRTNYYSRDGRIHNGGIDRGFVERKGGYRIAERQLNNTSDYSAYKSRVIDDGSKVRVYIPGESDVKKVGSAERNRVMKAERKTNLDLNKIPVKRENRVEKQNSKVDLERNEIKKSILISKPNRKEVRESKGNRDPQPGFNDKIKKRNNVESGRVKTKVNSGENKNEQLNREKKSKGESKPLSRIASPETQTKDIYNKNLLNEKSKSTSKQVTPVTKLNKVKSEPKKVESNKKSIDSKKAGKGIKKSEKSSPANLVKSKVR